MLAPSTTRQDQPPDTASDYNQSPFLLIKIGSFAIISIKNLTLHFLGERPRHVLNQTIGQAGNTRCPYTKYPYI